MQSLPSNGQKLGEDGERKKEKKREREGGRLLFIHRKDHRGMLPRGSRVCSAFPSRARNGKAFRQVLESPADIFHGMREAARKSGEPW